MQKAAEKAAQVIQERATGYKKKRPADLSIFTVVQQLVSRGLAGSVGAKIHKILGMTTGIYNKSTTTSCRTLIKDLPKVR